MSCPGDETILAFSEGRLSAETLRQVEAHALGCTFCQDLVAAAMGTRALKDAVQTREAGTAVASDSAETSLLGGATLSRGATIGRYTILERLGRGGMGDVYAAYDRDLDRKIALKLLRTNAGADRALGQARLLREAKVLAKVSHPNIVIVYDAGSFDGRVFVAMEFVDGMTLSDWLLRRVRTLAEILAVFRSAGRGLAAVHAAGLVHRDFKPQNVMIDKDGNVRVMDFGLAREFGDERLPHNQFAADQSLTARNITDTLTASGQLMGTPLYMAPEQFKAEPADARTDQFSFCVALYRALYGQGPFGDTNLLEVSTNVLAGRIGSAPATSTVPAWLRRVVVRGLSLAPDARWPSINALIDVLARDPTIARRRWIVGAGALSLVALTGFMLVRDRRAMAPTVCRDGPTRLANVWEMDSNASAARPRRDGVRKAFLASGAPDAADIWNRVAAVLDRNAEKWVSMYRDACEATHLRHIQTAAVLDLRVGCLDQRRSALTALTEVFAVADRDVVRRSINAANALPAVDYCADIKALTDAAESPGSEAASARVEELGKRLAVAKVLNDTGKLAEALKLGTAVIAEARALGYRSLIAEALGTVGEFKNGSQFSPEAITLLEESVWTAVAARRDDIAARSGSLLTAYYGYFLSQPEQSRYWSRFTHALLERMGPGHDQIRAWLLQSDGLMKLRAHDLPEALNLFQRAMALKESSLGANHPDVAQSVSAVAETLHQLGRNEEALRLNIRAYDMLVQANGPATPLVAVVLSNRGEYLVALDRAEEAVTAFREALVLWPDGTSPLIAYPLSGFGQALLALGRAGEAIAPLEKAVRLRDGVEPESGLVAETRFALARALWTATNQLRRARELARKARATYAHFDDDRHAAIIDRWLATHGTARTPRLSSIATAR